MKKKIYGRITVKLSEVNKIIKKDKVYIFKCSCMGIDFLNSIDAKDGITFAKSDTKCPSCGLYPWHSSEDDKALRGKLILRKQAK